MPIKKMEPANSSSKPLKADLRVNGHSFSFKPIKKPGCGSFRRCKLRVKKSNELWLSNRLGSSSA